MSKNLSHAALVSVAFTLLLITPIAMVLSRNVAYPLLLVVALLLAASVALQSDGARTLSNVARLTFRFRPNAPASAIALVTILFALLSLLWTPDFEDGFGALAQTSVAALVSVFCCLLIVRHTTVPAWLAWALPLAIVAGCMLILSELTFGSPIRGALGASTEEFRLNRAAVSVTIMLPLLFLVENGRNRLFVNLAVVALVWVAAFTSTSETAKLAAVIVTGTLVLAIFVRSSLLVLFCCLGVLATHILAPFIATALYTLVPREAIESLSTAVAQHPYHFIRTEIWWAYAQQVLEAPIFGNGLEASKWANDAYAGSDPVMPGALSYGHPHSASLQTWYELGLVGVTLSTGLIVFLFRQILRLPDHQQKVAVAIITGVWTVAYVSHGAWQHWWWALVGIVAVIFSVLVKQSSGTSDDEEVRHHSS